MITDTELRKLRPKEKAFKVADREGMYVTISTAGTSSAHAPALCPPEYPWQTVPCACGASRIPV